MTDVDLTYASQVVGEEAVILSCVAAEEVMADCIDQMGDNNCLEMKFNFAKARRNDLKS